METITQYIRPELLILAPVLYLLGALLKKAAFLPGKWIPLLLGGAGVVLCVIYGFATTAVHSLQDGALLLFTAMTQGLLVSGVSVYCNQLFKQLRSKNDGDDPSDGPSDNEPQDPKS